MSVNIKKNGCDGRVKEVGVIVFLNRAKRNGLMTVNRPYSRILFNYEDADIADKIAVGQSILVSYCDDFQDLIVIDCFGGFSFIDSPDYTKLAFNVTFH